MESGSPRVLFSSDRNESTATDKRMRVTSAKSVRVIPDNHSALRQNAIEERMRDAAQRNGARQLTETLVLLLEGHDPRREQAAEAEPVALRHGERRVLRTPTRSPQ